MDEWEAEAFAWEEGVLRERREAQYFFRRMQALDSVEDREERSRRIADLLDDFSAPRDRPEVTGVSHLDVVVADLLLGWLQGLPSIPDAVERARSRASLTALLTSSDTSGLASVVASRLTLVETPTTT